jgi:DNA-binding NtrC family response regulator
VILLDIKIPGMDGIEVLRRIKRMKKKAIVVMITAYGSIETAREAMELGAYEYITKPIDLFLIKSLVGRIFEYLDKSR